MIACALSGQLSEFGKIMANPTTWIIFFTVLVNFFLSVVAFFGEEYGWRYYLQPLLQKKFGLKGGVILLAVCGCMASANRLLLLHYAGYGAGGSGKPVCYLYFTGDFYGIYLYENPEYLGPDNYSFSE